MVIQFYFHPQSPPCQIVWMTLRELRLEFNGIETNLYSEDPIDPQFLAVNPRCKIPAIKDGDFTLAESRAIAIYLCQQYEASDKKNKLYPEGVKEAARMNMNILANMDSNGGVEKYLNGDIVWMGLGTGPVEENLPRAKSALALLESMLQGQKYLGGDHLTILDFCATVTTGMMYIAGYDGWGDYPLLDKWRERMKELPYFDECHSQPIKINREHYASQSKKFVEK